jgi:hypothetical protein
MNNAQKFIIAQFEHVEQKRIENDPFKPQIKVNFGLCDSKHISITWDQFEHIKQYLIDSEKGE